MREVTIHTQHVQVEIVPKKTQKEVLGNAATELINEIKQLAKELLSEIDEAETKKNIKVLIGDVVDDIEHEVKILVNSGACSLRSLAVEDYVVACGDSKDDPEEEYVVIREDSQNWF